MSFQKPATDHFRKVHIAAVVAAFTAVAVPTLSPIYHWLFPKEKQFAANDMAIETQLPALKQQ